MFKEGKKALSIFGFEAVTQQLKLDQNMKKRKTIFLLRFQLKTCKDICMYVYKDVCVCVYLDLNE